jgi:hypothetical protein
MKWGIDANFVWHAVSDEGRPACGGQVAGLVETSRGPGDRGSYSACVGCTRALMAEVEQLRAVRDAVVEVITP